MENILLIPISQGFYTIKLVHKGRQYQVVSGITAIIFFTIGGNVIIFAYLIGLF